MALYAATIFLGAFLLFQVQPIVARYILPWYGGSPAVWTTCMLFFQLLLVAGYLYAHLVGTRLDSRRQAAVHLGLLLLAVYVILGIAFYHLPEAKEAVETSGLPASVFDALGRIV